MEPCGKDRSAVFGELMRARRAVTDLMSTLDRRDPVDEATFAAIETMLSLLRVNATQPNTISERMESLREANRSARAIVVATGYALTTLGDRARALTSERGEP